MVPIRVRSPPNGGRACVPAPARTRERLDESDQDVVSVYYEIDGERYPRVTAVCAIVANEYLAYWRGRVGNDEANRISREATTLGTKLHKALERINEGGTAPYDASIDALVQAYRAWFLEHVRSVAACEQLAVSRLHKYAGTVDLVAYLDDDPLPTVIDMKTSNSVSNSWGLQTAAYQLALDEGGLTCGQRMIVQIPSREPGALYTHLLDDHDRDQRAFLNALKLYRWRESLKPPEQQGPRIRFNGATARERT
jgi:hypothetical protein